MRAGNAVGTVPVPKTTQNSIFLLKQQTVPNSIASHVGMGQELLLFNRSAMNHILSAIRKIRTRNPDLAKKNKRLTCMKSKLICVLIGVWPLLASAQNVQPIPSAGAGEASITLEGVRYENIRWGRPTPASITIYHKNGAAKIPLDKLPPYLQKRFNYDAIKAAEYRAADNEAEAKAREQRKDELQLREKEDQTRRRVSEAEAEARRTASRADAEVLEKKREAAEDVAIQKRASEAQEEARKAANESHARVISDEIRSLKFEIRALESELGSMRVLSSAQLGFDGLRKASAKRDNLNSMVRAKKRLMGSKQSQLSALQR